VDALRKEGLTKPPAPLIKTIWATIGEHDDDATIVTDSRGNPEPDPALRDTENVPLTDDIEEYFAREVLPYVPNAWIELGPEGLVVVAGSASLQANVSVKRPWR
jgi:type I restriction enzyme M protein